MKMGDKVVCIKNILTKRSIDKKIDHDLNEELYNNFKEQKYLKADEIMIKIDKNQKDVIIFENGKVYEVAKDFADIITIKDDLGEYKTFSDSNIKDITDFVDCNFSEHFITLKESLFKYPLYTYYLKSRFINITEQRRIKLKRLNDV